MNSICVLIKRTTNSDYTEDILIIEAFFHEFDAKFRTRECIRNNNDGDVSYDYIEIPLSC